MKGSRWSTLVSFLEMSKNVASCIEMSKYYWWRQCLFTTLPFCKFFFWGVGGCTSQGFNVWHFPLFVRLSQTFVMIQKNSKPVYHACGWSGEVYWWSNKRKHILNDKITKFAAQSHLQLMYSFTECVQHFTCQNA